MVNTIVVQSDINWFDCQEKGGEKGTQALESPESEKCKFSS